MISFTIVRQNAFVLLFTIVVGGAYDSTTPFPSPAPDPSAQDGLLTSRGSNPSVLRLASSQLVTAVDRVPATANFTASAEPFNCVAFDGDGGNGTIGLGGYVLSWSVAF